MSRPLRIELADGLYHVTARGDRREAIFRDDRDRVDWLRLLGEVCGRFNWRVHAYCEMTNHYYFVVETADANLSKGMRQLNGVYTQTVNRRHGLVGHVFQGRFKAILVERDTYLLELARYVVLNPVRAGMVREVGDWPWSSYLAMMGTETPPAWLETDWLLGQFASSRPDAQGAYAAFVREGIDGPSVWDGLRHQMFLGNEDFVERHRSSAQPSESLREISRLQRRALVESLADVAHRYSDRREAMAHAFQTGIYSMREIADYFGVHYSTVSRAVRRFETGG